MIDQVVLISDEANGELVSLMCANGHVVRIDTNILKASNRTPYTGHRGKKNSVNDAS